jgi:hypothetical protein
MKQKIPISPLLFLIIPFGLVKGQQAVIATGKDASGASGSIAYSVGQNAYSMKGSNREISEGVQQPYEIQTLTVGENPAKEPNITLYPNPVNSYLFIDFINNDYHNSQFVLFDGQGKLIKKGPINDKKYELNLMELPSAVYFIQIIKDSRMIKSFKIIKK